MQQQDFDAIVVGAGLAGVACAGELVLHGKRPLLISETSEVASTLRSTWVGNSRGVMQHPVWQLGWGGGWWYPLVRALNIPMQLHNALPFGATYWGSGKVVPIPYMVSGASVADLMMQIAPFPLDDFRKPLEELCSAGLAIPYQELLKMDRVSLVEWMEDRGTDPTVQLILTMLLTALLEIPISDSKEVSVLGAWGTMRTFLCGEGITVSVAPDAQFGLCVPICEEVERRGGAVWKGRKVDNVLVEGGKVAGVLLQDGTEVRAPQVAIAAGNPRIPKILRPLPVEAEAPLAYSAQFTHNVDFNIYTVLDAEIVSPDLHLFLYIIGEDGSNLQYSWPIHPFKWTTEPGKHFVAASRNYPAHEVEAAGGPEKIYAEMLEVQEHVFPGFEKHVEASNTVSHKHHWSSPILIGPKLPRVVESVPGLFFVGDGSTPVGGTFMDCAASTGIMGARAMVG